MTINKVGNQEKLVLEIEGRIDTSTAQEAGDAFLSALEETNILQLDFSKVKYVSSAGLRSLLNAQKFVNKTGKQMLLINVSEEVLEVFEMTGFIDILTVE